MKVDEYIYKYKEGQVLSNEWVTVATYSVSNKPNGSIEAPLTTMRERTALFKNARNQKQSRQRSL